MKKQNDITLKKMIGKMLLLFAAVILFCPPTTAALSFSRQGDVPQFAVSLDKDIDYEIQEKDKTLILSFSRPVADRFAVLSEQFPALFDRHTVSPDGKTISLPLKQAANIQSIRSNNSLILSFHLPPDAQIPLPQPVDMPTARLDFEPLPDSSRFIITFPHLPVYRLSNTGQNTDLILEQPFRIETATLKNYPRAQDVSFRISPDKKYILSFPEPLVQSYEQPDKIILDIALPAQNTVSSPQPAPAAAPADISQIRSLSFPWNMPVNIAVFRRGEYLWIIFDHTHKFDIDELSQSGAPLVEELVQLPYSQAAVLRMRPRPDVNISLRREGLLWIVDLFTGREAPEIRDIPIFTQYDAMNQAYLFAPTSAAGKVVNIFDPEIGDLLSVIPIDEIGRGMVNTYRYPDIDFNATINGIAITLKADDVIVNRGNTGITVSRPDGGLNISEDLEQLKRQARLQSRSLADGNFLSGYATDLDKLPFNEAVERLTSEIISASPENRVLARLNLSEYYIGKGLGPEALSVLNALQKENAPEAQSGKFYALHGMANFLSHRYDEAEKDFSHPTLSSSDEADFWRVLSASAENPRAEDNAFLMPHTRLLKDYPAEIRRRIALVGIESALAARDDLSVQSYIDIIRDAPNDINKAAIISYYTAQKLSILGYPLNAIREFRNTAAMPSQQYSALARREIVDLQRSSNTISPEKAIAEYERLRFAWPDKKFRISLLNELTDMYVAQKDYRNALASLQDLRSTVPPEEQEEVTRRMVSVFEDLYLNNNDDKMPAVKSLALYGDYKWLAPLSKNYNAIVQKLADRLVAVDLLERAYQLLDTQLRSGTLSPLERGTIGTRMALISLFKNQPSVALDILDKTESDDLTPTIIAHRRIIRAKALSAVGRPDEALELLKEDYSPKGIMIKSEIYWDNEQWADAADTIKYLIEKPTPDTPLSQEQLQLVLDWATALKRAGRSTVIVRLRNTFEPYFKDTAYYSAFNVLTETFENDKIDIKAIDKAINNIAAFHNFAKLYSQSLQNNTLSQTIQ